jgi:hypothetical protein
MRKLKIFSVLLCVLVLTVFTACSGSDGITIPQPTTAVITLATTVVGTMPANTIITGYDVTVSLPQGVTVRSTTAPPQTDAGVVAATGEAVDSLVAAVYSAATGTLAGTVHILIVKEDGFNAGEFSTVNCDIAAGYYPEPTDFPQPTFAATGFDTNTVSNVDLSSRLTLTATAVIQ